MDMPTFRGIFPEFSAVPDAMVTAYVGNAALEVDVGIWGAKADLGVAYLAAHRLALSPYGQNARMKADNSGKTTYFEGYRALKREVTSGYRVC